MDSKKCSRCEMSKSRADFYRLGSAKDGLQYACKKCQTWYRQTPAGRAGQEKYWKSAAGKISHARAAIKYYKTPEGYAGHLARQAKRRPNHREEAREYQKSYRKSALGLLVRRKCHAMRRATRISATPKWANHEEIEKFYKEAADRTAATGIMHHVDHIIPLRGKLATGLHVETNLQVLTASENIRKGNRMPHATPTV